MGRGWVCVFFFYRWLERGTNVADSVPRKVVNRELLLGIALYYGVLAFNLGVTFCIGEIFMGMVGCFIVIPLIAALLVTLWPEDTFSPVHGMLQ